MLPFSWEKTQTDSFQRESVDLGTQQLWWNLISMLYGAEQMNKGRGNNNSWTEYEMIITVIRIAPRLDWIFDHSIKPHLHQEEETRGFQGSL